MNKPKTSPGYAPNASYSRQDWDDVCDNPEWTETEMAEAEPLEAFAPDLAAAIRKARGPQKMPTKRQITLRLDQRVIDHFKASGDGWQRRMNEALLKAAGL